MNLEMHIDRRGEPRQPLDSPAIVQSLGESAKSNGTPFQARVVDINSRGLRLQSGTRLDAGAIVKVEVADQMILGEVCYCFATPDESFSMGIFADQSLRGVGIFRRRE